MENIELTITFRKNDNNTIDVIKVKLKDLEVIREVAKYNNIDILKIESK